MSDATFTPFAAAAPAPVFIAVRAPRRPIDWAQIRAVAAAVLGGAGDAAVLVVALAPALFTLGLFAQMFGFHVF